LGLMMFSHFVFAQKTDTKTTGKTKTYSQMGFDEKIRFVAAKSDEILALFGRTQGDEINAEGLRLIRTELDAYVRRLSRPKLDNCDTKSWLRNDLTSVIMRGSKNAAAISEEFSAQKLPPQIGLYTAMIESDFCPCLQSPLGALGMFQLLTISAKDFGLNAFTGASPTNPDERCQPKLAARAAAKYYRKMIDDIFGSDAVGLPIAIAAYNSGEGNKKRHITDVAAISKAPRISFWVLVETSDELRKNLEKESEENDEDGSPKISAYFRQFEEENIKYVPKFFAAAMIGENPQTFGIDLPPLSQIK